MIHYVYAIVNKSGEYLHIGETKNPNERFCLHVSKNGKFKRNEVKMEIIDHFYSKKEAFEKQCELQKIYGLQTDIQKCSKSASLVKDTSNRTHPKCIKTKILVYDLHTNKLIGEYKNQTQAAKALNISQTLISYILLGKQNNSKKYRFEYNK